MKIIIDSREHEGKNEHVLQYFRDNGIEYINKENYGSIALKVGDYMSDENKSISIDRKQSMIELVGNVCQQHDRFQREMLRAKELGIQLVILIEHGRDVRSIDDVEGWVNPRLKKNPRATTGATLAKVMRTMQERYGVRWEFTTKAECGERIVDILGGGA